VNDAPAQPRLSRYPTKVQAKAKTSFHSAWYTGNNWLEYSQQEDAAFCYPCRHFALPGSNPDKAFTAVGYSNWKKPCSKMVGFRRTANQTVTLKPMLHGKNKTKKILDHLFYNN